MTDIFDMRCGGDGCHIADEPAGGLDLMTPGQAMRMVNVPAEHEACPDLLRIDPTNVDDSLLLLKLSASPPCGAQMPLVGEDLSRVEQACVREWVEEQLGGGDGGRPDGGGGTDGGGGSDGGGTDGGGGSDAGGDAGP